MTTTYQPGCGWEGPRGGDCPRKRSFVVQAGDPAGAYFASDSCDKHLDDLRVQAFRVTGLPPLVFTDAEWRERAERLRSV